MVTGLAATHWRHLPPFVFNMWFPELLTVNEQPWQSPVPEIYLKFCFLDHLSSSHIRITKQQSVSSPRPFGLNFPRLLMSYPVSTPRTALVFLKFPSLAAVLLFSSQLLTAGTVKGVYGISFQGFFGRRLHPGRVNERQQPLADPKNWDAINMQSDASANKISLPVFQC